MFYVTRRFEFDAAHRLSGYPGACAFLHGHRYGVEVTIAGERLDDLGMVMDFGELKMIVQEVLDCWDHNTILKHDDPMVDYLDSRTPVDRRVVRLLENPTAETFAKLFYRKIKVGDYGLPDGVRVYSVKVSETPDCWVEYRDEDV